MFDLIAYDIVSVNIDTMLEIYIVKLKNIQELKLKCIIAVIYKLCQ